MPVTFAPFATFAIYAIIQTVRGGQTLLANRMFTSLSLISLMTDPLLIFIQTLPSLWESVSCFSRIEQYCTKAPMETSTDSTTPGDDMELSSRPSPGSSSTSVVEFQNASFSWTATGSHVLHGISFAVQKGHITAVIGSVGSGKSTLLESSLGETTLRNGSMSPFSTSVAYCPQTPWIMNDTIRQNIIGPAAYDPKWYSFVVWACALEPDFENIAGGDLSKAGSSGPCRRQSNISQSLARAVYSRAPTLVLDDVFSGLDNKSVVAITTRLLASTGHFRESGRTVIIATHNHRLLPHADRIVVLENGTVRKIGSFEEIESELPQDHHSSDSDDSSNQEVITPTKQAHSSTLESVLSNVDGESLELDNARRDGKWSVYSYYFKSAGWTLMISLVAAIFICGFTDRFSTIWLEQWSNANQKNPDQSPAKALLVPVISNTGRSMHAHLLKATLRFSQDLELIDMDLPIQAINTNMSFANCVVQLVLLCILGKYLTITVPALGVILFLVQSYYLRTSRQVRLLDIEAKSPLFTHFVETMQGITVIRAMRWQTPFQTRLQDLLNQSQKPFYMLFCIRQWLQLVLDCIVMALAVVLVSLVVSLRGQFSAGSIGVALNLILVFSQDLMQFIKSWTVLETSIGAVARIQEFVETTPSEEQHQNEHATVSPHWPERGHLTFDRVTASYGPNAPPVLNELSLAIEPGQKIAVCGPSGSGKTSLILGLLQMIELRDGSINLDGIDLSTLSCSTVRSRINVVPQEPFFMPGTLRFNLDRQLEDNPVPDSSLIRALEAVGLWKKVREDCPDGGELDQPLSISNWSMGERQLLALARALVVKSPILILDEAMSSVDWETEATMQDIIDREFTSQTVISVIHRLRYVERYDRVALMKHGRLVEYASPGELLAGPSEFASFYNAKKAPQ
ncbi:Multidrug resistance-associated protein 1 [Penicillium subrubescens]|uniref:Multidrug resistance-associated protein 1 n=1 Tax=Penicillium subrubescens TaxID=1316194 RepID=A0A1Q5SRJ4_9EURO|nr:Multidrug resistance-associated protein 1 [Penicillium subrubescens]